MFLLALQYILLHEAVQPQRHHYASTINNSVVNSAIIYTLTQYDTRAKPCMVVDNFACLMPHGIY